MKKTDLPEYQQFNSLNRVKISLSDASRKYDVSSQTLYKWVGNKYISVLEKSKVNVYLNEQDVAYCAFVYHRNPGQGKWTFNEDGTPYEPKGR